LQDLVVSPGALFGLALDVVQFAIDGCQQVVDFLVGLGAIAQIVDALLPVAGNFFDLFFEP